jgi:hypothetical protein
MGSVPRNQLTAMVMWDRGEYASSMEDMPGTASNLLFMCIFIILQALYCLHWEVNRDRKTEAQIISRTNHWEYELGVTFCWHVVWAELPNDDTPRAGHA